MPFRLQDGALPRAAARTACPRPFSRFFALAVWAGGLLTTVIRPQPCGLVSLRMGITQYSEVSAEYASLLVENYTNALRSVRKYDLEFFQPLAAPPEQPQIIQTNPTRPNATLAGRRRPQGFERTNEGDRAKLWTNARIVRGNAEAAETHQTRRWRDSRTVRDHGDSRVQRTSSNGGDGAELQPNAGRRTREIHA